MFRLAFLLIIFFISSCANQGLLKSGAEAETNLYYIGHLRIGMSEEEVWDMMGRPYKVQNKVVHGQPFTVWYYITKGKILGQTKILARNLTPLVFQDKVLKGWGRRYYHYLLDIDNGRARYESRERQKYTDDRDEWAPDDHGYVPSPYEKEQARQKKEASEDDEAQDPNTPRSESRKKNPYERINKYTLKKKKQPSDLNKQE